MQEYSLLHFSKSSWAFSVFTIDTYALVLTVSVFPSLLISVLKIQAFTLTTTTFASILRISNFNRSKIHHWHRPEWFNLLVLSPSAPRSLLDIAILTTILFSPQCIRGRICVATKWFNWSVLICVLDNGMVEYCVWLAGLLTEFNWFQITHQCKKVNVK